MAEANECLKMNLEALNAGGQALALRWLQEADGYVVEEISAANGDSVLMVSGQSQSSRHDPRREAEQWLERQKGTYNLGGSESRCLFGFGNPWIVELLLKENGSLSVFEPNPNVVKTVLSRHDFREALAGRNGLRLLTPWHAADNQLQELEKALLLVHPPAQRREAAQLVNLKKVISGGKRNLSGASGHSLRIMIIPPLSGGSWPVAVSLARAVEETGHKLLFQEWDAALKQQEAAAHQAAPDDKNRLVAKLFEATAPAVAATAAEFAPDLLISLAQAPLDAAGLAMVREKTEALAAFWLVEDVRSFGYVANIAPSYDALFHIQEGAIEPTLRAWGLQRGWYLPMAADANLFKPLPGGSSASANSYAAALSFMGAGYPNRRKVMGMLAEKYWPTTGRPIRDFRIFGSGWNGISQAMKSHLFENGRRVSLPECVMIYSGGQVNLNIHSSFESNPGFDPSSAFVNPRTFEIASAGSLQLVDSRPLLPPLFQPGRELVTVENPLQLPELISHYLAKPEEAAEIGQAARARVLKEHTYQHRLERMLNLLGWNRRDG
ncbi:hypothetical protein C4J81_08220 [Deltaproteobacteria bacterium Smac51]|nr:hypothetical protein C4J81_08220 [Deltaproteobacteria bacterium Smac51]